MVLCTVPSMQKKSTSSTPIQQMDNYKMYDLRVLEDDKGYFPPYHALPLVRTEILKQYPELEEVLLQLAGKIDETTMQKMNAKVDNEGMMVETVAKEFLQEAGFINKYKSNIMY